MSLNLLGKSSEKLPFPSHCFPTLPPSFPQLLMPQRTFLSYSMHAVSLEVFGEEAVLEAF